MSLQRLRKTEGFCGRGGENPLDSRGQGYWKIDGRLLPRTMLESENSASTLKRCVRKKSDNIKNRSLQ